MCPRDKNATPLDEWLPQTLSTLFDELRAELSTSFNTIRHRGARVAYVADRQAATSAGTLLGWAINETSGVAPATVALRDGTVEGDVVITITLAPGESTRDWFGPGGISLTQGLYIDAAGAAAGSVFLG